MLKKKIKAIFFLTTANIIASGYKDKLTEIQDSLEKHMDKVFDRLGTGMKKLDDRICVLNKKVYALEALTFPDKARADQEKADLYISAVEGEIKKCSADLQPLKERVSKLKLEQNYFFCTLHGVSIKEHSRYYGYCKETDDFIAQTEVKQAHICKALSTKIERLFYLVGKGIETEGIDRYRIEDRLSVSIKQIQEIAREKQFI